MLLYPYRPNPLRWLIKAVGLGLLFWSVMALAVRAPEAGAQSAGTITLRADVQEANANTGIVTATGNVQIDYPARQISATAAQAQYYSNERRIVLSGNVVVLQEGNTLRAETVTYLVDEGRFVALPQPEEQVEATYILPAETPSNAGSSAGRAEDEPTELMPVPSPPATLDLNPIPAPE